MTSTKLTDVRAGGHVAGGSVFENCDIYAAQPQLSRIASLLKRFNEGDHGEQMTDFAEDLQVWTRPAKDASVHGIGPKLEAAGRADQVPTATEFKERVYADLVKLQFSQTYQRICLELLDEIWERFEAYVKPAILAGAGRTEIDALVHEHVVQPVTDKVANCGVDNDIRHRTIRGMLYFLTGNCHVKWTA